MSDGLKHAGSPPGAPQPGLVLAFSHGANQVEQRLIPRSGLLLGHDALTFDNPLDDKLMAERHAEVHLDGRRARVRDLGTEVGTRVNGRRVVGEQALEPGDVLRCGDTLFVYALLVPGAPDEGGELSGSSGAMVAVRRSIATVAARKHSVVVTGSTGTGKEVVARLLHECSGRSGPFIAVNCGTFTEGLLASDLFGHVRGAFTGAVSEQQGLFRAAMGGTLLLDEVVEIPLAMQGNLLRVLEMNEVRPVGGTRHIATDVRVIATSNRELVDVVQDGLFRPDLYSRLAQWTIRLPPLRERREDIPRLTEILLSRCDGAGRALTPDLAEALLLHDWPLNVRGLFNVLSVAVISTPLDELLSLNAEVTLALSTTKSMSPPVPHSEPLPLNAEELSQLMERFKGKVTAVARHLGVTRPKLYRMLDAHGLEPAGFRRP